MMTRAEEEAHIDFVDDQPGDGPDAYWCLYGFDEPAWVQALAAVGCPPRVVLTVESEDDSEEAEEDRGRLEIAEEGKEALSGTATGEPPLKAPTQVRGVARGPLPPSPWHRTRCSPRFRFVISQFFEKARLLCAQAPAFSPLKEIAWLVGDCGFAFSTFMPHLAFAVPVLLSSAWALIFFAPCCRHARPLTFSPSIPSQLCFFFSSPALVLAFSPFISCKHWQGASNHLQGTIKH